MKKVLIPALLILFIMLSPGTSVAQFPTNIKITVLDGLGNLVEGAVVKLFLSEDDYRNNENVVVQGTTNKKGQVKFKKLDPQSYFVDARKDDLKNDGMGAAIAPPAKGKMTKVNIIIE